MKNVSHAFEEFDERMLIGFVRRDARLHRAFRQPDQAQAPVSARAQRAFVRDRPRRADGEQAEHHFAASSSCRWRAWWAGRGRAIGSSTRSRIRSSKRPCSFSRRSQTEWTPRGNEGRLGVELPLNSEFGTAVTEATVQSALFVAIGILVGLAASFTGLGGGFIMVPLLLFLGFEAQRAVGTSFMAILVISTSALAAHGKLANVDCAWGSCSVSAASWGRRSARGCSSMSRQTASRRSSPSCSSRSGSICFVGNS